jgi:hypothetical protein
MEGAVTPIPVGFQTLSPKKVSVVPHIAGRRKGRLSLEINLDEENHQTRPVGKPGAYSTLFNITFAMCAEERDCELFI